MRTFSRARKRSIDRVPRHRRDSSQPCEILRTRRLARAFGFWIPAGAGRSGAARVLSLCHCRSKGMSTEKGEKFDPPWEFPHFGYDRSNPAREGARPCGTALANAIGAGGNHAGTARLGTASRDVDRRRLASWMACEARKRQLAPSRRNVTATGNVRGRRSTSRSRSSTRRASRPGVSPGTHGVDVLLVGYREGRNLIFARKVTAGGTSHVNRLLKCLWVTSYV